MSNEKRSLVVSLIDSSAAGSGYDTLNTVTNVNRAPQLNARVPSIPSKKNKPAPRAHQDINEDGTTHM